MIIRTFYFEIRDQHLNKVIKNLNNNEPLGKYYSLNLEGSKHGSEVPWTIRLLSFRIWEEVKDTVSSMTTVALSKCPKELRENHSENEKVLMLAKLAAINLDKDSWG